MKSSGIEALGRARKAAERTAQLVQCSCRSLADGQSRSAMMVLQTLPSFAFPASLLASYVTGTVTPVDGGMYRFASRNGKCARTDMGEGT
jgi:NAD(P)-dependent dehydrogenase (short-subunit alcohol dehydrogenase family)